MSVGTSGYWWREREKEREKKKEKGKRVEGER